MKASDQTMLQLERAVRKIAEKFPSTEEPSLMTDIHIRVTQDTGELMAFDDDDREITRCVVEQWMENRDDDFYSQVASQLRQTLSKLQSVVDAMSIIKPYAFVLEDDEREQHAELYVADDDTIIIDPIMMNGLDEELDAFFEQLMKE